MEVDEGKAISTTVSKYQFGGTIFLRRMNVNIVRFL
jgi:hypothetical protein